MDELRVALTGLTLDPSQMVSGQTAITEAQNVVFKRTGLVETRGGLECYQSDLTIAASVPDVVYAREDGSAKWYVATDVATTRVYEASNVTAALTLSGDPGYMRGEPMNDRQCWTFPKALRMLDAPETFAGAFTRIPGAPRGPAPRVYLETPIAADATKLLKFCQSVAYRIVIARRITTTQGLRVVYGAPSDRVVIWGGDTVNPTFTSNPVITVPLGALMSGDEVQVYRTDVATGTDPLTRDEADPGDEMYMIAAHLLTSTPGSTSTWSFTDSVGTDTQVGPSLYTNETSEGIAQSNYRIRTAKDVAWYNNMAFYAGGSPGQTYGITCKSLQWNTYDTAANPTDSTGSLHSFVVVGDTSIVTNTTSITNCNPTVTQLVAAGATLGMHVCLGTNDPLTSAGSPAYGTVTALNTGANRITLSTTNTATTVGTTFVMWDWLGVAYSGGQIDRVFLAPVSGLSATAFGATSGVFYPISFPTMGQTAYNAAPAAALWRVAGGGFDIERAWAARYTTAVGSTNARVRCYTVAPTEIAYAINLPLRFEWEDLSDGADCRFDTPFEFVSSKPYAFSTEVGLTYSANLCRSTQEGGSSRLWVSKVGLPEAVPLGSYYDIGNIGEPIGRIVATTDSLWVFKRDGLWRVYGDTPESLVIQPFDPLARFEAGSDANYDTSPWVRRVGNSVVAWTSKGILIVDSTGARNIDLPIRSYVRALTPGNSTNPAIMSRAFSGVDIREGLVVFGCRTHTYATQGFALGLHIDTGAWFTMSTVFDVFSSAFSFLRGSGDSDMGRMILGVQNGFATYYDPAAQYSAAIAPGLPLAFADRFYGPGATTSVNITAVAADGVTITLASARGMLGCLVTKGGQTYIALPPTDVALTTTLVLDRAGITTGACTIAYYPIDKVLTYGITTSGAPQVDKFFVQTYVGFQSLRGGTLYEERFRVRGETASSSWVTNQYPTEGTATPLTNSIGLTTDQEFEDSLDVPTDQTRGGGLQVSLRLRQAAVYCALDSLVLSYDNRSNRIGGRS